MGLMTRRLLVVGCLMIASCGVEQASLEDEIVGTWVTQADIYVVFDAAGTHGVGHSLELATGTDERRPEIEFGTWVIEGSTLTFSNDRGSKVCAGMTGVYEIEIPEEGDEMLVTVVEDECEARAEDFGGGLTRTNSPSA